MNNSFSLITRTLLVIGNSGCTGLFHKLQPHTESFPLTFSAYSYLWVALNCWCLHTVCLILADLYSLSICLSVCVCVCACSVCCIGYVVNSSAGEAWRLCHWYWQCTQRTHICGAFLQGNWSGDCVSVGCRWMPVWVRSRDTHSTLSSHFLHHCNACTCRYS